MTSLGVLTLVLLVANSVNTYIQQSNKVEDSALPRFLDNVDNITHVVGRDALLRCNVDQLKSYKVAWVQVDTQTILTIHKQVITRNPRITLLHDDHKSWHLKIENVQEKDRGWYMCQVNTDPMRSRQGYLDVVVPPDIVDRESSGDLTVKEGEDVSLQCKARGHPIPTITWRREDGNPLNPSQEHAVLGTVQDKVEGETLTLEKVKRLHMGSYLCIASNNVPPSISKRIELSIQFPPMTWVPHQLEGAYIGQDVTIECHTEASPKSINYWTNGNGEMIISDDRYESILVDSSYKTYMKLRIRSIKEKDFGNYSCIAKNSLGQTDGSIKIYKIDPPVTESPDISPDVEAVDYTDYHESEHYDTPTTTADFYSKDYRKVNRKNERNGLNEISNSHKLNRDSNDVNTSLFGRRRKHYYSPFGPNAAKAQFDGHINIVITLTLLTSFM